MLFGHTAKRAVEIRINAHDTLSFHPHDHEHWLRFFLHASTLHARDTSVLPHPFPPSLSFSLARSMPPLPLASLVSQAHPPNLPYRRGQKCVCVSRDT